MTVIQDFKDRFQNKMSTSQWAIIDKLLSDATKTKEWSTVEWLYSELEVYFSRSEHIKVEATSKGAKCEFGRDYGWTDKDYYTWFDDIDTLEIYAEKRINESVAQFSIKIYDNDVCHVTTSMYIFKVCWYTSPPRTLRTDVLKIGWESPLEFKDTLFRWLNEN